MEQKLNININELDKEVKINNNLKLKLTKYRTKFKNFINYIQSLLEESRENKNEQKRQDMVFHIKKIILCIYFIFQGS